MSRALLILAICFIGAVFSQYPITYIYENKPQIQFASVILPNEIHLGQTQFLSFRLNPVTNKKITEVVIAIVACFPKIESCYEIDNIIHSLPLNEVFFSSFQN